MKKLVLFAFAALVAFQCPVWADEHRLQPDFTFKRVTVPTASSTRRITVQVTPQEVAPLLPEAGNAPTDPAGEVLPWFWEAISPQLDASGPGRLHLAVEALRNAPDGAGVPTPRLQTLQQIASAHGRDILRETVGTQVSPALVLALISVESAGQSAAESHAGAQGLMQLMPATAERFGVQDRLDPSDNIKGGVAYLAWLMNHFGNDPVLVLAGYNAGEGAVRDNSGVPPYAETRGYVPKVIAAWTVARSLCMTPPELVTDGCVFSVGG